MTWRVLTRVAPGLVIHPRGLVAHGRMLLLGFAVASCSLIAVMLAVTEADPSSRARITAYACLLALLLRWAGVSRLERWSPVAETLEILGTGVIAYVIGDPSQTMSLTFVAIFFTGLIYRSMYGSIPEVAARTIGYAVGMLFVAMLTGSAESSPVEAAFQACALAIMATLMRTLAGLLAHQERSAAREQALLRAGTLLASADDADAVCRAVAATAIELLNPCDGAGVSVLLASDGAAVLAARSGQAQMGPSVDLSRLSRGARERLAAGEVVADPDRTDRSGPTAEGRLRRNARDARLIAPVALANRLVGAVVIDCPGGAPAGCMGPLRTLGIEGARALERIRLAAELRLSEKRFRSLVQSASDIIMEIDDDFAVSYQSPSAEALLGYADESVVGMDFDLLVHPDDCDRVLSALVAADGARNVRVEARLRHANGSYLQVESTGSNLLGDPELGCIVLHIRDITERKALEDQLAHRAFHDPLTGLANRALFVEQAKKALANVRRTGAPIAVAVLDLDDFKRINDTLGHSAGDRLLTVVGERLMGCIRPSDIAARLGGDEFALLLEHPTDEGSAVGVAMRALALLSEPVDLGVARVIVRTSIGIALSETGEEELDQLLHGADTAMYRAKRDGKATVRVYDPGMADPAFDLTYR